MGEPQKRPERTETTAGDGPPPRFATDEFYRALAATHRRRLLSYLLEETDSTVDELATVLGGWEATTTGTLHTGADRAELRGELVHNHLPRLADTGLVAYDPETGSVQIESLHPEVADLVRRSVEAEQRDRS